MTRSTTARVAGIAFLVYIPVALGSGALFSRATPGSDIAARIAGVPAHLTEMRLALILVFLSAFSALVLAATLYGLTREADREAAAFGLVCRAGEGILGMYPVGVLGMLWLGTVSGPAAPDAASAAALGAFLLEAGQWKANTSALLFAAGSTGFAWAFLRGRLVPLPLARLGVAASLLLVVALPLQMAGWIGGLTAYLVMWMPMLAFELWLAVWLIATGAERK